MGMGLWQVKHCNATDLLFFFIDIWLFFLNNQLFGLLQAFGKWPLPEKNDCEFFGGVGVWGSVLLLLLRRSTSLRSHPPPLSFLMMFYLCSKLKVPLGRTIVFSTSFHISSSELHVGSSIK